MERTGIAPVETPIRGGTDGAMLSYKGLPCPNLFTGAYNFHGRYEYASVQEMESAVRVITEIARIYGACHKDASGAVVKPCAH